MPKIFFRLIIKFIFNHRTHNQVHNPFPLPHSRFSVKFTPSPFYWNRILKYNTLLFLENSANGSRERKLISISFSSGAIPCTGKEQADTDTCRRATAFEVRRALSNSYGTIFYLIFCSKYRHSSVSMSLSFWPVDLAQRRATWEKNVVNGWRKSSAIVPGKGGKVDTPCNW